MDTWALFPIRLGRYQSERRLDDVVAARGRDAEKRRKSYPSPGTTTGRVRRKNLLLPVSYLEQLDPAACCAGSSTLWTPWAGCSPRGQFRISTFGSIHRSG